MTRAAKAGEGHDHVGEEVGRREPSTTAKRAVTTTARTAKKATSTTAKT